MEFTKLVKYGSASLFLILVLHGLVLGFTIPTTVLSVVLVSVVCLFEAQLVKSERDQYSKHLVRLQLSYNNKLADVRKELTEQVTKVSELQKVINDELQEKIDNTRSQMSVVKMSQGIKRL